MRQFALLSLIAMSVGCGGGRATVNDWQRQVEQYVELRGHGDPNVLRDADERSGWPVIAVNGGDHPEQSTDVVGLLVGQATVGAKPWMVFLVASVSRLEVEEVRVAALSTTGQGLAWRLGSSDSRALQTYHRTHRREGGYPPWPGRVERYELSVAGDTVTVTERTSGARWQLMLTESAGGAVASALAQEELRP